MCHVLMSPKQTNKMQLTKNNKNFDSRKLEEHLTTENKYIIDLFSILSLPTRNDDSGDEEEDGEPTILKKNDKSRAQSLCELQERLHTITSKKKLTYKEKLAKKNLKNKLKKKNKQDERNAQQKLLRVEKMLNKGSDSSKSVKTAKPVFNSEGKMVFSKFDFTNLGTGKDKKQEKDPKKLLKKLEETKEKLDELHESGEVSKVVEIKEKAAWKNALAKAEGQKVKDDPQLLKKTVHRQEQKKRASQKKWKKRQENVDKGKQERQQKRATNIEKRKKEKRVKKMKKAVKKGKVIPGF